LSWRTPVKLDIYEGESRLEGGVVVGNIRRDVGDVGSVLL